jgi:uncharacterized membrane protein YqjE
MDADSTLIADRRAAVGGLTQRAHELWTSAKGLVHDHTLLALLEVQRASLGLVKIIGAAVIISVLAVSAWMGLVAAGVVWAVGAGASWGLAIAIASVLNLVAAGALAFYIKKQVPELLFAATLRQLRGESPDDDDEDDDKVTNGKRADNDDNEAKHAK